MDVTAALKAICSTGKGCCWYCDRKLPAVAEEAIRTRWDVQRVAGDRVASIILVCPECGREKAEVGEKGFRYSQRDLNATREPAGRARRLP
jgi:hypothetical protein